MVGATLLFFAPLLLARATYLRSAAPAPRWSLPLVFDEAYMGAISRQACKVRTIGKIDGWPNIQVKELVLRILLIGFFY